MSSPLPDLNWQPFGNGWWAFIVSRQEPLPTSTAERSTIELSGAGICEFLKVYKYCGKLLLPSFEQIIYIGQISLTVPMTKCPDCGCDLVFQEGCKKCPVCGWGVCG